MLQHLRHPVRSLFRSPLITVAAILTLAVGIGGATAVFSVVQAVVLKPLPFHEPDRLVRIWALTRDGDRFSVSDPEYLVLRAESRALADVAAYREVGTTAVLADDAAPMRISAIPVSASLAAVLGVQPQLGRMFSAEEDHPGRPERLVVLSNALWRQRFAASGDIVGRIVTLDDTPFVVTGVMPPRFDFPGQADAWIPLRADPRRDAGSKELAVIGRLRAGATPAQLADELRDFGRRMAAAHPQSNVGWSAEAAPFSDWIVAPRFRDAVWILFGAVALLLVLACANVANLLVAQAASRQTEMRIRSALGASRSRLVRELFTESALLATLGTAAGVLAAVWLVDAVRAFGGSRVPRLDTVAIDAAVLVFACLAGGTSCLLFGLAPALHVSAVDLRSSIDEGLRSTVRRRRLRHVLVVVEVALALVLVVGAALMGNSFVRLTSVDPGFAVEGTLAVPIDLPSSRYPEDRVAGFYTALLERVRAIPGVTAAGATSTNPFRARGFSNSVTPEERAATSPSSGLVQAGWRSVTPGFFEALAIPLRSGRGFRPSDGPGAERVVVVSDSLARRLWPAESPIGKRIYWGGTTGRTRTVVGVVADIRDVELEAEPPPMLYVPHPQVDLPAMTLVVRTADGLASVAPAIRVAVREADPELPAPPVDEIASSRREVAAGPRFQLLMLAAFAAIALVLAATGVYAMLAFTVAERRREIAVRMTLGASGRQIAGMVLRDGVGLTLAGVAAGLAIAFAATRVLSGLLFDVEPTDPLTFAAAAAGLTIVAAIACYLPAHEAARVDPAELLRRG